MCFTGLDLQKNFLSKIIVASWFLVTVFSLARANVIEVTDNVVEVTDSVTESEILFFWGDGKTQEDLITHLKRIEVIRSDVVADAMSKVDRQNYLLHEPNRPYGDFPSLIMCSATVNSPSMVAFALEELKNFLKEGNSALDVGSGSGYTTACMAMMVGPSGRVIGVEHMPPIFNHSLLSAYKDQPELLLSGTIHFVLGEGRLGVPQYAPYDAIHVGASTPRIPQNLIDQLKPGGRMLIPVGEAGADVDLVRVDKYKDGRVEMTRVFSGANVAPLTTISDQLRWPLSNPSDFTFGIYWQSELLHEMPKK